MKRCPTCKQVIADKVNVRTCYKCLFPIGRHDKYRYVNRVGITTIEHRHCDNKESYLPAKVKREETK
jgi:hypothetical protein